MNNKASLAGLIGLASLAAQAQVPATLPLSRNLDPVVVTATRSLTAQSTLRDAVVITREDIESAGPISLGELLERHAGIELRATGGPGQPQGLFVRGAGTSQTLVLVDGMRTSSATVGTTAIEHIPLELIERIEVVKGPVSSLWGSEAMGGVVQVFTRGRDVPHLFTNVGLGTDSDRRVSAGLTTIDKGTAAVLTMGYREVDAPSATTDRAPFCHDPDRDPYDNAYANLRLAHRLWQGENIVLEAFGSRGRAYFDGCGTHDRNEQVIGGVRLTSSAHFADGWKSRLAFSSSGDELKITGAFPDRFQTRQDQATWINEVTIPGGSLVGGVELLRQSVESDLTVFAQDERETRSGFVGVTENWRGQRFEASWRRDDDDAFGTRDTGSAGYGFELAGGYLLSATFARGFRAPTFYDLYGPTSDFYVPNPDLRPETNRSKEFSIKSPATGRVAWRATYYDNRIDDLIAFAFPTVVNVNKARIRGIEANAEVTYWNIRWRGSFTTQRPENEATGARLLGRAEHFGSLSASRSWGAWTGGVTVHASGDRYDSPDEAPGSRLGGYAKVDARVSYRMPPHWTMELSAVNLFDKRYETSVGYEGTRRGVMLSLRFDAF